VSSFGAAAAPRGVARPGSGAAAPSYDTTVWRAATMSRRSPFTVAAKISEKLRKGWIVSLSTSSGTRARMASVACCNHSPASGPSA
jgi:hypothetical protein